MSSEEGFFEFKITPPPPDWGEARPRGDGLWWEGDLRVGDFPLLRIPGRPALPYRAWRIAVPEGSTYRYEIVSLHYREFRSHRPQPVPSFRYTEQGTVEPVYEEDPAVYQSDAFYPESPVRVRRGGVFRGIHFVSLEVAPVLMHPREGRTRYYDRLVVRLYIEGAETEPAALAPAEEPDPFFREAPRHFLNSEQARRFKAERVRGGPTTLTSEPFGFPSEPGLPGGPLPASDDVETEGDSYKLTVTQNGLYRLDYTYLTTNAPEWIGVDPRYFRLYNKGQEIPIYEYNAVDVAVFEDGDYLEFYAEGHFGENLTDRWDEGDYTDKNVYWLQLDSTFTLGARVETRNGLPGGASGPASFQSTVHYEEDVYFVNGPSPDPAVGHPPRWYWEYMRAKPADLQVSESAAQLTDPLTAQNGTVVSDFAPAFTLPPTSPKPTSATVDYTLSGGTNLDLCVTIELLDPVGTPTTLKLAGTPDANPYVVTALYTGPGTYQLRLTEVGGCGSGDAVITQGKMDVTSSHFYTFPMTVPSAAGGTATFDFKFLGLSSYAGSPDHHVRVRLNPHLIPPSPPFADEEWDDTSFHTFTASTSQVLLENSLLQVETVDVPWGNSYMLFYEFDLTYPRLFEAYQDELAFSYGEEGAHLFEVSQFTSSDVAIYDISDKTAPIRIVNADVSCPSTCTATFEDSIPAATSYSYFAASVYRTPDSMVQNTPSDLKNASNGADWIVITPDEFYNDANLNALVSHRALQCADIDCTNGIDDDGDGLTDETMRTMKVRVEDIYDEFSFGIITPYAVQDFVFYAYHNWTSPPPAYVLLVGEATFDYKNNLGMPSFYEHAPTPMFDSGDWAGSYAGDVWYAMVDPPDPGDPEKPKPDDFYPDLHVGRFSVRDATDLAVCIDRLLNLVDGYEEAPLSGPWQGKAVMVSEDIPRTPSSCTPYTCTGSGDPPECEFERAHDDSASFMAVNEPEATVQQIYYDKDPYFGCNTDTPPEACGACTTTSAITADIQSALNGGALLVSYLGHGAWSLWSQDDILNVDDLDALTNGGMAPWVINSNCYTGGIQGWANYFQNPASQECLMEKFLRLPLGGAVAAYSESGIGFINDIYGPMTAIFQSIFGRDKYRNLGTLTMNHRLEFSLTFESEAEKMKKFILLGDPATDLVLAAPAPSPDLRVQSVGDGSVTLEWDPSPDPTVTGYHVWCKAWNESVFSKITATPVPAGPPLVVYTDATPGCAGNTKDFYYYVASVNADGFQGPSEPSSLDDPDSVKATPLNPDPPAAPDLTEVQDLQTGMRLKVLWNANVECDLLNYTIHYDTDSGVPYANSIDVGNPTTPEYVIGNLTDDVEYCFAMTATNTSSKTSGYSLEEKCATPTHAKGYAPPAMITDLKVELSPGGNPLLKWTAPSTDIYGVSMAPPVSFAIYRQDGSPDFKPDRSPVSLDRIAEPSYGSICFLDDCAFEDTSPVSPDDWFYYVTAYDANAPKGESSVGRPYPQGINEITVVGFLGWYNISWVEPSPLLDIAGDLTDGVNYHIYGEPSLPDFQPDRYGHTNRLDVTTLPATFCCPIDDGCKIEHSNCAGLTFKVVIEDVKGNEGLH